MKGVGAKLFKVKDKKYNVALDTAGGGKVLYNAHSFKGFNNLSSRVLKMNIEFG